MLDRLVGAVTALGTLQSGIPAVPKIRLRQYVNLVTATRNASRAAIAVSLAGLFWLLSGWSSGSVMLSFVAPVCALLGLSESAAAGSVDFAIGIFLSVVFGIFCNTVILPQMTGFPLLMLGLLPFLALAVYASTIPRYTGVATAFAIFFNAIAAPTNPPVYRLAASLDAGLAFLIGGVIVLLAFRVLLPPNPVAEAAVLARSLVLDVRRLARLRQGPSWLVWENLQHQKLVRLSRRLASQPAQRTAAIEDGCSAVLLGRGLAHLIASAHDSALPAQPRRIAADTVPHFRNLMESGHSAAGAENAARAAATALSRMVEAPQSVRHLAAALYEMSDLLHGHAAFFAHGALGKPGASPGTSLPA